MEPELTVLCSLRQLVVAAFQPRASFTSPGILSFDLFSFRCSEIWASVTFEPCVNRVRVRENEKTFTHLRVSRVSAPCRNKPCLRRAQGPSSPFPCSVSWFVSSALSHTCKTLTLFFTFKNPVKCLGEICHLLVALTSFVSNNYSLKHQEIFRSLQWLFMCCLCILYTVTGKS